MALRHIVVLFSIIMPFAVTVLDDNIKFALNWPGKDFSLEAYTQDKYSKQETVKILTHNNEQYECTVPTHNQEEESNIKFSDVKPPSELLSSLFSKKTCTYRLGSYWQYEICHGKHIRQFHEEKTSGGGTKLQEYYLGHFPTMADENGVFKGMSPDPKTAEEISFKKIDGVETPYYAVEMTNGTPCDLMGGVKRKTRVLYVCDPNSRNGMASVAETSSCEYEVVVSTPLLCDNPFYKVKNNLVNDIYCSPLGDSPSKPKALMENDKELPSSQLRVIREEIEVDEGGDVPVHATKDDYRKLDDMKISAETDKALLRQFLKGEFCLTGNSGWWSYEFCYGKHVKQYHIDKVSGRTIVMVGLWDRDAHLKWAEGKMVRSYKEITDVKENKVEKKVHMVEHFYHNGDFCDAVKKPREVIVRLKCKGGGSKHSVTIYLREPTTCSYILGIESPIICDLLDTADENGLFDANI